MTDVAGASWTPCADCPVVSITCPARGHPRYCALYAEKPEVWGPILKAKATGKHIEFTRWERTERVAYANGNDPATGWLEAYASIRDCPYRLVLHPDERPGCGCKTRCLAGLARHGDGLVDINECIECLREDRLAGHLLGGIPGPQSGPGAPHPIGRDRSPRQANGSRSTG